jgi:hypothetical protein
MEGLCPDKRRGRDKREYKNNISAENAQSETEGILNRQT